GFYGPLERMLRAQGANLGFVPADFRRYIRLYAEVAPRVMATAATPPDSEGWCSLSLHAGASIDELLKAGRDPERVLVVETSPNFPRTYGFGEERHAIHVDDIDVLVESDASPFAMDDVTPTDTDRAIAAHVEALVRDGATIQTGIGGVPSMVASLLAEGDGGDYGIHGEMFTDGLMRLQQSGKVTNRKGTYDGVSVATFALGSRALYDWLDENHDVAFLPVELVNSPEAVSKNRTAVTINGAMSIDISGQVVADTIDGNQYSGIGGHEDFVSASALSLDSRSIICLPSTVTVAGEVRSRIVPWHPAGTFITTPRHQVDLVVTEYGIAELQGHTVHQRGMALAEIAHPDFREELRAAAQRASGGSSPLR
ncbi:MAG: 4-hydroxybutyrate CoA-transferase, partial [Actinobacteria bacterium]|nr:4-hydroxybutyrate CoA-transferase [Actinomycetota bacterium]